MLRGHHDGETGASAVEFALVLSLVFLLVFGTVQFGITYNRYQGLQAGSREGARIGSLPDSSVANIHSRVENTVSIIAATSRVHPCPSDLSTLAANTWCIKVQRRLTDGTISSRDSRDLSLDNAGAKPCAGTTSQSVLVESAYRARVEIPPVMWFPLTISAGGEFECES